MGVQCTHCEKDCSCIIRKTKIKLIDNELVDKQKGCKFWENKAMIEIVIVKRLEVKRAN